MLHVTHSLWRMYANTRKESCSATVTRTCSRSAAEGLRGPWRHRESERPEGRARTRGARHAVARAAEALSQHGDAARGRRGSRAALAAARHQADCSRPTRPTYCRRHPLLIPAHLPASTWRSSCLTHPATPRCGSTRAGAAAAPACAWASTAPRARPRCTGASAGTRVALTRRLGLPTAPSRERPWRTAGRLDTSSGEVYTAGASGAGSLHSKNPAARLRAPRRRRVTGPRAGLQLLRRADNEARGSAGRAARSARKGESAL
jgi:hypothetical protein